jgi:hypothetical protein
MPATGACLTRPPRAASAPGAPGRAGREAVLDRLVVDRAGAARASEPLGQLGEDVRGLFQLDPVELDIRRVVKCCSI